MKKFLFWTSMFCTSLVCVFMWTKLSLNGYKADVYFFVGVLLLNVVSFWTLYKANKTRRQSFINFSFATLQIVALSIFLSADTLQVDKVYNPGDTKYNLYSSWTGWYKRAYFKEHQAELCKDGELWETRVPYYFPLVEIETARDQCHKVSSDSTYALLYKHVPE